MSQLKTPKYYRKYHKRLRLAQKRLSRKQFGSNNRNKARIKVAALHQKIANCRLDSHHKLSRKLVDENHRGAVGLATYIVFENLNIKGMSKNHKLAKSIADAAWGMLQTLTEYKAKQEGKVVVYVDRFFPSSKTCNSCRQMVKLMPLRVISWKCPQCGQCHDKDINAAKNLRDYFAGMTKKASGSGVLA